MAQYVFNPDQWMPVVTRESKGEGLYSGFNTTELSHDFPSQPQLVKGSSHQHYLNRPREYTSLAALSYSWLICVYICISYLACRYITNLYFWVEETIEKKAYP